MEIKEIKGYFGTGCKLIYACILDVENDEVNILDSRTLQHAVDTSYGTYEVRLALRPLSDLTKEIEHNGEKVNVYEILGSVYQFYIDAILKGEIPINYLPYECIEILLKYHFDIHNLIEKGEAININTLK